jgi:uncharacterized protein YvpB
MIGTLAQADMSGQSTANLTGKPLRGAGAPRGPRSLYQQGTSSRAYRSTSRRELLSRVLPGMLIALAPVGLARAAPQPRAGRATSGAPAPASAHLLGYPLLHQQHVLSCEAAVASMATRGRLSEQQILDQMPYNANPWLGFRGNVNGGQSLSNRLANYGIYAPPVAKELQRFGYQAQLLLGSTAPALLRYSIGVLKRPVAVWVTRYLVNYPAITGFAQGRSFALIDGEHTRLAIGYDGFGVQTLDPDDGPRYDSWAALLASWARFDYMGIVVGAKA